MPETLVTIAYLAAGILFIFSLGGLSAQESARRGNLFGMVGMTIAVLTTVGLIQGQAAHLNVSFGEGIGYVLGALVVGGSAGAIMAKRVEMTKMPELVAFMHSMIGLAAVFIAVAVVAEPWALLQEVQQGQPIPTGNRLEVALGAAIGAITFSGSVIAFGKLSGKYKFRLFQGAPVVFPGQHMLNLVLGLAAIALIGVFMATQSFEAFLALLALSFILGVLIIIPIGGADMPVVVSMLNSYSGWAAAGIGFSLNNSMLIIAGSLVGSSGAILSYIMCKAMNRSFFNVILGGFGGDAGTAAAGAQQQRSVKSGSADDAAFIMGNAETVVIVPGYGLAVAVPARVRRANSRKPNSKMLSMPVAWPRDSILKALGVLVGADLTPRLAAIRCPVLLIHPDGSPFIPVPVMADFHARVPGARFTAKNVPRATEKAAWATANAPINCNFRPRSLRMHQ